VLSKSSKIRYRSFSRLYNKFKSRNRTRKQLWIKKYRN